MSFIFFVAAFSALVSNFHQHFVTPPISRSSRLLNLFGAWCEAFRKFNDPLFSCFVSRIYRALVPRCLDSTIKSSTSLESSSIRWQNAREIVVLLQHHLIVFMRFNINKQNACPPQEIFWFLITTSPTYRAHSKRCLRRKYERKCVSDVLCIVKTRTAALRCAGVTQHFRYKNVFW